ncbi:neurogenic locus notch homolog protein 3-like isoform X2 [Neoarius graeffei]|uniref:neurogenic locus notch homolog protein 3-like isoform X2 n=1 Tax=Neoarius graeffei TaxID=443677 RepID=UPI00298BDDF5|nr:neurogenic locus notch homolog protein 3-like isoform X2 [Neoarius graeffei]
MDIDRLGRLYPTFQEIVYIITHTHSKNYTMTNIAKNLNDEVLTCRAQRCNNLGKCVIQNGEQVCECILGYRGDACEDTVNDGLAVPLTLGVLGFIIGFVLLAFALALLQQKRKKLIWYDFDLGRNHDENEGLEK